MNVRRAQQPKIEPYSSPLRAVSRLAVCVPFTVALIPLQFVALAFGRRTAHWIPRLYHRLLCRILGFDVRINGSIAPNRPTLFVSNHVSYIDIVAFGSILNASFVAKAEIAGWPLFGVLARLHRTVFVERRRRHAAKQRDQITRRLEAGDNIILFPEGTSDDGQRVLPFKSALFSVTDGVKDGVPLTVQPVSVAYTRLDGIPLRRAYRPQYAWYGDMRLVSHIFEMLGIGTLLVEVTFHQPVAIDRFPSRKALADFCYKTVVAGLDAANSGRPLHLSETAEVLAKS